MYDLDTIARVEHFITLPEQLLHYYAIYTRSRDFNDPLFFIPESWTGDTDRLKDGKRVTLQPTSMGSRDCVGM